MQVMHVVGLVVAMLVGAYLFVALLKPEWFS